MSIPTRPFGYGFETEALRFGRLKLLARSDMHFEADVQPGQTPEMRKGSGLHSYMLGDSSKIIVTPMRRDPRSEKYQEWCAQYAVGRDVLIESEMKAVQGMRKSLEKHSRAMELLEGTREQTHYWKWCGRDCRGTPDVYTPTRVVELKTARSSDPRKFPFQARSLYYHAQLSWYWNGLRTLGLMGEDPDCYIVAVESAPPYPVTVYNLTYELVDQGLRTCRLWMERLNVCERYNIWPAYAESDVTLDVAENELDLDLSGLEDVETAAE